MSVITNANISIPPYEIQTFHTGTVIRTPDDVQMMTDVSEHGLTVKVVTDWMIDRDEMLIQLINGTDNTISIHEGDLVCKLVFEHTKKNTEIGNKCEIHEVIQHNYTTFLNTIAPDYKTMDHVTGHRITLPRIHDERKIHLRNLEDANNEYICKEEVALNIAKIIKETTSDQEKDKLQEEKMMTAMCDIFENSGKLSADTFGRFQNSDKFCSRIKNRIYNGNDQPSYTIIKDVLLKTKYDKDRQRNVATIVIPDDLMPLVCKEIHTHRTIHQPITGSMTKFQKHFYNRYLRSHMKRIVDNCIICKYTEKPTGKPSPGPGRHRTLVMENLKPREGVALDLAIGLPMTKNQSCHALTVICLKTNYGQIYPLRSKHAREVCRRFENGWIKHFMAPKYIYADLGSEFAGEMTQLCSKYGITHYSTFPESQQGNRAELMVKAFKNNVKKFIHEYKHKKSEWEDILPMLLPKINQSILHQTKTISRELLFFGDEISMPTMELDTDTGNYFENREINQETYLVEYDKMRQGRKNYYKPRDDIQIKLRDIVFIKNRRDEHPKSLKVQYVGPMRVSKIYPLGVTAYHMIDGTEMSAHYNHIKKLTLNQYDESMPKSWEADIQKLILNVAKAKRTNKVDIIFEEAEYDDTDILATDHDTADNEDIRNDPTEESGNIDTGNLDKENDTISDTIEATKNLPRENQKETKPGNLDTHNLTHTSHMDDNIDYLNEQRIEDKDNQDWTPDENDTISETVRKKRESKPPKYLEDYIR